MPRPHVSSPRRGLRIAVVALGLTGAGWATAEDAPAPPPATATQPATPAPAPPKKPAATPVGTPAVVINTNEIESVLGKSVLGAKGEDMGRIVDVLIDRSGDVRAAVIDFGGFFGVGSRKIAVDWDTLHFKADAKADVITTDVPADELRTAPVYKEGEPVVVVGGKRPATRAPEPAPAAPSPAAPAPKPDQSPSPPGAPK